MEWLSLRDRVIRLRTTIEPGNAADWDRGDSVTTYALEPSARAIGIQPEMRTELPARWWVRGDLVTLLWGSHNHWVIARLRAQGDTLTGVAQYKTDVVGPPIPSARVIAVRRACPP